MKPAEVAAQIVERVGSKAEAQVVVDGSSHALTRFANSFIHQNVAESGLVVYLKLASEGRVAATASRRTDDEGLENLVNETLEATNHRPPDDEWPGLAEPAALVGTPNYDASTAESEPMDRAERVKAFIDSGPDFLAAGYCDTQGGEVAFANSIGQTLVASTSRATLDGIHQSDTSAGTGHATSYRLGDIDAASVGDTASDLAARARNAVDIDPGDYEVVLGPECVATILHFLSYYGMNAKAYEEGQSYVDLGSAQFDSKITIYDDPFSPLAVGGAFDSDGTPKQRLDLVVDGVSSAIAHDRRSAARIGAASTGHAYPGSDVHGPMAANLHLSPGDESVGELIGGVDRGLLVTEFNYSRILDPRTQVVTGLTRNGTFLIEKGEITQPVKNLRFTQSLVDGLGRGRVLGIGRDARLADGEFGVGIASTPAIRLAKWHFSGGSSG